MRHVKTEAIIIKRRNYRDADRILTLFTKDYGKLHVRAAGVRKITSRRSAHIELLNHSILSLYKAHAFPVLTEAQTIDNYSEMKKDLHKVGHAYYICELIDGLCPENQELRQVFGLLQETLNKLNSGSFSPSSLSAGRQDSPLKREEILPTTLAKANGRENDFGEGLKVVHNFEIELLFLLGYWNKTNTFSYQFDVDRFIEGIIERKIKSKNMFTKLR